MQLDFLTPPVRRLNADGSLELVHEGSLVGRLRRPVVLLARNLCTFAWFDAAALPRGRRTQAAALYARTATPYVVSASALVKSGDDFGVWWWDVERIQTLLNAANKTSKPILRPETLAQPTGSGWRIVKLAQGYEAQLWANKGLRASVWRRDRFDAPAWSAFTRLQRAAPAAEASPPPAENLPIATDSEAFALSAAHISREQAIGLSAAAFATVAVCASLFLLGQGLKLSSDSNDIEQEAATIRTSTPRAGATAAMEQDRKRLIAYREVEERTNPVSAAGAAIGIVAFHDLTPSALEAGENTLTLTLPYDALDKADALIEDFQGSGYFYDVQPRTDAPNKTIIFEMKTREAAPPLTAAG